MPLYTAAKQVRFVKQSLAAKMIGTVFVLCTMVPLIMGVPLENFVPQTFDDDVPDPRQLAESKGYSAESHEVTTEDGYVLTMFRITGSKSKPSSSEKKIPVLLMHGLLDCAATWIITTPEKSLAFLLADRGYDVWLGNARGNRYARRHLDWTVSNKEYWLFSWHEIGVYDIPAMIDYILKESTQEKLYYMGHSQGGTAFFVMASERREYQDKIIASFNLAPAVFMDKSPNIFFHLVATQEKNIGLLADLIGMYEFKPSGKLLQMLGEKVCDENSILEPLICKNVILLINGFDDKETNMTLMSTLMQYAPAGASTRQMVHYGQLINSGKFRQLDHGLLGNLKKYGQIHPPDYDVHNIRMPVYLHYSTMDTLVGAANVRQLYNMLPNAQKFLVPYKHFSHIDFVWGKHMAQWVYSEIFSLMARHEK